MNTQLNLGRVLRCAGLMMAFVWGTAARANVIHVNTTADPGGSGMCSVRDAVAAAKNDFAVNGCAAGSGPDTIVFDVSGIITLRETLFFEESGAVTIDGTGRSITLDGNNSVRQIFMNGNTTLNLKSLTVANGLAAAGGGGAIYSNQGSGISILNSTFTHNTSGCGGAIYIVGSNIGTTELTIVNSTFHANAATTGECGSESYYGGAILAIRTAVTVKNSTFSSNRGSAAAQLGIVGGSVTLANTILTDSLDGPTCTFIDRATPIASGMNLVGDSTCGSDVAHFTLADPKLGPLADNGGPTPTRALLPGSPAIDAADNAICVGIGNVDQRGQVRPSDGNLDGIAVCDVGAYELGVVYPFTGFLAPVHNAPVVNSVNAGKAVPLKFSLAGNRGLAILASGYPQSMQVACSSGSPVSDVQETSSAGGSSLSYDSVTNTYTYVWKTDKSWSNTCRTLTLRLSDGTDHTALFQFK